MVWGDEVWGMVWGDEVWKEPESYLLSDPSSLLTICVAGSPLPL